MCIRDSCENGTDDILSKNSKIIKSNKIDFDNMKMDELIDVYKRQVIERV